MSTEAVTRTHHLQHVIFLESLLNALFRWGLRIQVSA